MVVKVIDNFDLFLDYFGKNSVFDSKQTSNSSSSILDSGIDTHPKRHPRNDFQNNTAKTPDIDGPWIFVHFHFLQHLFIIFKFILKKNVVEDLWGHVFGSSHGELFEIGEEETTAKIDKFNSSDVINTRSHIFLSSGSEENVLGFEVGMDDVVAVDEEECLDNFDHDNFKFSLVLSDPLDEIFVLNLNKPTFTL